MKKVLSILGVSLFLMSFNHATAACNVDADCPWVKYDGFSGAGCCHSHVCSQCSR